MSNVPLIDNGELKGAGMSETMKWHCVDCKASFQGPMDRTPENGCEQCGSKNIFDCNVEFVGLVIPYPIVTSHRKCEICGEEMRHHGYIEELNENICPSDMTS